MSGVDARVVARGRKEVARRAVQLERLVVEYVPIETVKPNDYNPNRQDPKDFELLCRSMSEDGFTAPIVVQRETREIVDGEHRWRAARQLGLAEIPVVFTDMTAEQMRIATLRHNRAVGSEDGDLLGALFRDLRALGAVEWAQDALGIDDDALQRLIDDVKVPEALGQSEEFSEAWAPSKLAADESVATAPPRLDATGSLLSLTGTSTDAAAAAQAKFASTVLAASPEERVALTQAPPPIFRLVAVYTAEDARVVQGALGARPAERVLEMCRKVVGT